MQKWEGKLSLFHLLYTFLKYFSREEDKKKKNQLHFR